MSKIPKPITINPSVPGSGIVVTDKDCEQSFSLSLIQVIVKSFFEPSITYGGIADELRFHVCFAGPVTVGSSYKIQAAKAKPNITPVNQTTTTKIIFTSTLDNRFFPLSDRATQPKPIPPLHHNVLEVVYRPIIQSLEDLNAFASHTPSYLLR